MEPAGLVRNLEGRQLVGREGVDGGAKLAGGRGIWHRLLVLTNHPGTDDPRGHRERDDEQAGHQEASQRHVVPTFSITVPPAGFEPALPP